MFIVGVTNCSGHVVMSDAGPTKSITCTQGERSPGLAKSSVLKGIDLMAIVERVRLKSTLFVGNLRRHDMLMSTGHCKQIHTGTENPTSYHRHGKSPPKAYSSSLSSLKTTSDFELSKFLTNSILHLLLLKLPVLLCRTWNLTEK